MSNLYYLPHRHQEDDTVWVVCQDPKCEHASAGVTHEHPGGLAAQSVPAMGVE